MIAAQPRSIGEIFDRAVTLVVQRWSAAVAVAAIASVPATLAGIIVLFLAANRPFVGVVFVLLQICSYAMIFLGSATLMLLFGGDVVEPSALALFAETFGSFWRYVALMLLEFLVSLGATVALGIPAFVLIALARTVGMIVVAIPAAICVIALSFVLQLALAGATLERTGASDSIGNAFRRAFRRDQLVRTVLLGFAAILCYAVPQFVIGAAAGGLAVLTAQAWVLVPATTLEMITGLVFFSAVVSVAAIDYRVRTEGMDLEASLDASAAS